MIGAHVHQQSLLLVHLGDHHFNVVDGGNVIPGLEPEAGKRRVLGSVSALFVDGGEGQGDAASFQVDHDAKAELGVCVADPALSDNVVHQWRIPAISSLTATKRARSLTLNCKTIIAGTHNYCV